MEKKRSVGIIMTGIVLILFSLFCLIPAVLLYKGNFPRIIAYSLWLISGIGLLFLKNWARLLFFIPTAYILLLDVVFFKALVVHKALLLELPLIVILVFYLIYLTRPKVKEQFSARGGSALGGK